MVFKNLIEASKSVDKLPSTSKAEQQEVEYIYDPKTKKYASMSTLYSTSSEGVSSFISNKMSKVNSFVKDHFMDGMDIFSFNMNTVTSLHTNDNVYIAEYNKLLSKVDNYIKTNHITPDKLSKLYHTELRSELVGVTRGFKGPLISVTQSNILYPAFTQVDDLLSKVFPILNKTSDHLYKLVNTIASNPYKEITSIKTFVNSDIVKLLSSYRATQATYDKLLQAIIDKRSNKDFVPASDIVKLSNPTTSIWETNNLFSNFTTTINTSYYYTAVLKRDTSTKNEINRFNNLSKTIRTNIDIITQDPKVQSYLKTNEPKTRYLELMELTEAFAKLNTMFASLLYTLNQIVIIQTNLLTNQYTRLANIPKGSYV